jgi:N-acetylmuramoyl-L-alanine amidase
VASSALVVALALALGAGACSSAERPTLVEQSGAAGSLPTPRDGPSDDGSDGATTATTADPTGAGGSSTTAPATASTPATPPPITDPTLPPTPGLGAVLSPSGVLVRVEAETATGYIVETPCGVRGTIPWGQPVGPVQVVIDPGHGGDERGAVADGGLAEADLNLDLARRTAAELTRRSIAVVLTRNGDYRIPIRGRAALADAIGPAAFVSIHHNTPSSAPSATPGTEVYVQSASDLSRRLGGLLYEEVVGELSGFDVEWTSRSDAGVLVVLDDGGDDAYGIARYPQTPSALIEMAYLGNPKEVALLTTDDYRSAAALALADGIERYLTTTDPGTGFVDTPRRLNAGTDTGGVDGCVDPPLE